MPSLTSLLRAASTCLLLATVATAAPPVKRIAVLEFKGSGVKPDIKTAMADQARAGVLDAVEGRSFLVMSRENMAAMLKDMGRVECGEGECEVETARNIGADYVVTGEVVLIDDELWVTLKLHEAERGGLLSSGKVRGKKQTDVVDQIEGAARALTTKLFGPEAPRPPARVELVPQPAVVQPVQPAPQRPEPVAPPRPVAEPAAAARDLFARGEAALQAGRFADAEKAYRQALAVTPDYAAAQNGLGSALFKQGRAREAVAEFKAAVAVDPSFKLALFNLGYAARKGQDYASAATAYDAYTRLAPNDPDGFYGLGMVLKELGEPQRAITALERYLALENRPGEAKWVDQARATIASLRASPPRP